jgi:hypothetical protein
MLAFGLMLGILAAFDATALWHSDSGQPQKGKSPALEAEHMEKANSANAWQEDEHRPSDFVDSNL